MIKQKLYSSLIRTQYSLPALAFVVAFTVVACNIVALKHNVVYAASLLPASHIATLDTGHGYAVYTSGMNMSKGQTTASGHTSSRTATDSGSSANSSDNSTGSGIVEASATTSDSPSQSAQTTSKADGASAPSHSAPAPAPAPAGSWTYPLHTGIRTTWFYAGEPASADNDFIQNVSSAWQENWQAYFGGSDNPSSRCGYNPCGFTPRENPFYFALPFSDFTNTGPVADLSMVYWYNSGSRAQLNADKSILKNHWIQITLGTKTVYAQWEDVGPFNEHDDNYVFGNAAPASTRAGLDVSPAARDYLGMGGSGYTSWRFVTESEVPAGPWKNVITTSGTDWN